MQKRSSIGRALIIANPHAKSGAGEAAAERLQRFLELYHGDAATANLVMTERPRHATELASQALGFDTVIALGGDGVIHEVACGIMRLPASSRPVLGVLPVGSGNDYAMTLGVPGADAEAFSRLLSYEPRPMDAGRIDITDAKGARRTEYFVETCSVGLDAAIALGTYELRKKTGLTGSALYTASGLDVFARGYRTYPMEVAVDGGPARRLTPHLIAIQIGPTYGSGFRICPGADPQDGLFDVCYAAGPAPRAVTLPVFLAARRGRHTASRIIHMTKAEHVSLRLAEADYPAQADGERLDAAALDISIESHALRVLAPAPSRS